MMCALGQAGPSGLDVARYNGRMASTQKAPSASLGHTLRRRAAVLVPAALALGLWLYAVPNGLLGKADAIGYAVCHRIDLRSFHIGERALPLCSRCTGMYLGAVLSLGFFVVRGRRRAGAFPPWPVLVLLGLFGLAFAVDGLNSYLGFFPHAPHLYPPNNIYRLVTGTLVGLGLGTVVFPGFSQTAWRDWRLEPALTSPADLAVLLGLAAALVLAVVSNNPLLLYPLAIISSLGVLLLLTVVYTMMLQIILRRENQADSWLDLVPWAAGGLTLALVQVTLFDLGRYLLTGTWSGLGL